MKKRERILALKNLLQDTVDGIIDKRSENEFWNNIETGWRTYIKKKSNEKLIMWNFRNWIQERRASKQSGMEKMESEPSALSTKAPSALSTRDPSALSTREDRRLENRPTIETTYAG